MKTEREIFIKSIQSLAESVYDFHDRWNLINYNKPSHEVMKERKELLAEEVNELNQEIDKPDNLKSKKLLCREAADVLYVSVGDLLALGKDGLEAIDQVSLKNNKKTDKTHFFDERIKKVKKLNI